MKLNSKKLEKTSRLVHNSVSIILCLFLILLSNKIIGDLDSITQSPSEENFENKTAIATLENQYNKETDILDNLNEQKITIEKTIATAKENYTTEKQSFDNWVETRKTLGSPDKDQEVVDRAKRLDEFYKVEQDWRQQLNVLQVQIDNSEKKSANLQRQIDQEKLEAYKKYEEELKWYELKVFLIRLLFVTPILGLGIFFFIRYRKNKYWALYFGFTLFSLYAFFFGLVPYLPSYGGYVRYTVGVLLSVGIGYYAIKYIQEYIEKKQLELQVSTKERAKNVQAETAEKALENHFCPSCGKDFILKKWEFPQLRNTDTEMYRFVTSFCRHCGLELFKDCNNCGTKNFAHIPFCSSCGHKVSSEKENSI